MGSLEGRVALVTGSGRGIGAAIARTLADSGASICINDIDQKTAESTAAELEATGVQTIAVQADVGDFEQAEQMVKTTIDKFGKIDILVNNAGLTRDQVLMRMPEEDWDLVLRVNLKSAFNCSKAAIRNMMRNRYGRIVNMASVSGVAGNFGQTNYSASKAGMIGFTKSLAREVATRNITVNAVAPGYIPTDLTDDMAEEFKEAIRAQIPMGRFGDKQDVANAVAFFVSDEASYITGQVLNVDGGMVML
jgi:3-oxoacyl-[acyl-carrier protein] reductase